MISFVGIAPPVFVALGELVVGGAVGMEEVIGVLGMITMVTKKRKSNVNNQVHVLEDNVFMTETHNRKCTYKLRSITQEAHCEKDYHIIMCTFT